MNRDEEVTITGINGNTVSFSPALQYPHNGGANYVSDVSRNVVFASQEPNVVERRGQVMFMHDGDVQIEAAGFYGLGRTDKRRPIDDPVVADGQSQSESGRADGHPDRWHAHRERLDHRQRSAGRECLASPAGADT
jgi:hypothetical protein